ncbi:hypothetical protein GCM10028867_38890 [Nocardioides pacificus]
MGTGAGSVAGVADVLGGEADIVTPVCLHGGRKVKANDDKHRWTPLRGYRDVRPELARLRVRFTLRQIGSLGP